MTQTGIQVSPELQSAFTSASTRSTRLIRANINEESVIPSEILSVQSTWEDDFSLLIQSSEHGVGYYFYYIGSEDSNNSGSNSNWALFTYIPDGSKVKDRMIYAATKATIIRQLGSSHFKYNIHATTSEELSLEGFREYVAQMKAEAPLTKSECSLQELKKAEDQPAHGTTSRVTHVKGIDINVTDDTLLAVQEYLSGSTNLVMLDIDGKTETVQAIYNSDSQQIGLDQLIYLFPTDTPRFALYKYAPSSGREPFDVFIYSCPAASPLRDRMLYSAMRGIVTLKLQALGFSTKNRIEVDDPYDLTESFLKERLHIETSSPEDSNERELLGQSNASFRPTPPGQGARRPKTRRAPMAEES